LKFNLSEFSFHQRRGEVRGRPTTPPSLHYGGVPLPILLRKTGMIGFAMHQRRGEVRGRPTTKSGAFGPPPYALACTGMIGFAILLHINKIGAKRPKTCHLQPATCHYVIRFIDDGKRELERPTTKSVAFGPPPYALACTGMIGFATLLHINTIGTQCPETCHLQLATCHWYLCCSFHQRRGLVRGRPTTPPALHYGAVPLPICRWQTGMIGFAILYRIKEVT